MANEQPLLTGTNTVEWPVQRDRDRAAAQVEQANAQFAKMVADYQASPEQKLTRDRAQLAALENDPHHLDRKLAGSTAAAANEQVIRSRIAIAEAAIAAVPQTDVQRIDAVIAGQPVSGPEVTYGSQIPMKDFASAYGDILARGVRPELVKRFEETGRGDDPLGREEEIRAAKDWQRRLESDPEMQKRFLAKDPEIMKQFAVYGMVAEHPRRAPRE